MRQIEISDVRRPPPGANSIPRSRVSVRRYLRFAVFALLILIDGVAFGIGQNSERIRDTALSVVVPGLGLYREFQWLSIAFMVATPMLGMAWFRWGTDWLFVTVWMAAPIMTFALLPEREHAHVLHAAHTPMMHEITWVMALSAVIYQLLVAVHRIRFVERSISRFQKVRAAGLAGLPSRDVVERARAIGLLGIARAAGAEIAEFDAALKTILLSDVAQRARRINALARGRFAGDPLTRDHAHIRAARLLTGLSGPSEVAAAARESTHSSLGLIASEPGWVRLLDATLVGSAMVAHGQVEAAAVCRASLDESFALNRGRRPGSRYTTLAFAPFKAEPWEHVTATAVLFALGWIESSEEWPHVRKLAFGAVGRGARSAVDQRIIAAGRCWAIQMADTDALSLIARVSPSTTDPIAIALEALAIALGQDPLRLRRNWTLAI